MKKFIFVFFAILCALLAVACTDENNEQLGIENGQKNENEKSVEEIFAGTQSVEAFGEMQTYSTFGEALDSDTAAFFFGTLTDDPDMSLVKEYVLCASVGFSADEMGIFLLNDEKDADTVKGYFNTRIDNIKAKFKDYSTEEYEKASKAVVGSDGAYVWYIISSHNDALNSVVISAVNG